MMPVNYNQAPCIYGIAGAAAMNWANLETYMDKHSFLPADRHKIRSYVERENRMRHGAHRFVDGYLTRTTLCLTTGYGTREEKSRSTLGIQDNFT